MHARAQRRPGEGARHIPAISRGAGIALALILLSGCASAPPAPEQPPLDAGQVALSAERASALDSPYRLVFEWTMNEPGTRLRGRGVARIEPPGRARLDLFVPSGERVAAAAVAGERVTTAGDGRAELPAPEFLWGALGVFRPGDRSHLAGGRWHGNGVAELRYLPAGGGELLYRLDEGRIDRIEFVRDGSTREEVRLSHAAEERFPREAVYRHLEQVRELRITLESVEHVESYPSDIWELAF